MWDLWWTKWHWDRFFPEYFGFPLSISFHRCSITRSEKEKPIIFITGLHSKPEGCGASVASAAGPFTTKKKLTPRRSMPLQKLIVPQLVIKFPTFYETPRFITAFKTARHLFLS
jgi:hypothetical protein